MNPNLRNTPRKPAAPIIYYRVRRQQWALQSPSERVITILCLIASFMFIFALLRVSWLPAWLNDFFWWFSLVYMLVYASFKFIRSPRKFMMWLSLISLVLAFLWLVIMPIFIYQINPDDVWVIYGIMISGGVALLVGIASTIVYRHMYLAAKGRLADIKNKRQKQARQRERSDAQSWLS